MHNTDYIRYDLTTGNMFCQRCGDEYILNLPVPIDILLAVQNAFVKMHKNCKEKK